MEGENRSAKTNVTKNIKDIAVFVPNKLRPFMSALAAKKSDVKAALNKVSAIVDAIYSKQEEQAEKERAAAEAAKKAKEAAAPAAEEAPAPEAAPAEQPSA